LQSCQGWKLALGVHKGSGMKTLALVTLGGLLSVGAGCMDQGSDEASADSDVTESTQMDEIVALHGDHNRLPNHVPVRDATGVFTTVSAQGSIDLNNEFFQDLGTNGRRCVSCHVPTVGWTITPGQLKTVFNLTDGGKFEDGLGLSAVFRTVDGSNSPNADVSTLAKRRQAYSMLLNRGVIRIGLPVPANAEFELVAVDDPYKFASARELSLFRRPLPTTNLKFDSTVMWDGREVVPGATVASELATQSSDAVVAHAQGTPLNDKQRQSIVAFETALATAQITDRKAGDLHDDGAKGGPDEILKQPFYIGINDNFGDSKTGAAFTPVIFNLFDAFARDHRHGEDRYGHHGDDHDDDARRSIARGQALFNGKAIAITGVSGINDEAAFGNPVKLIGTCGTCHNTPNGGNHSVVAPLNIGLVDASRRTADMPLYTLRNKTTGQTVQVTDPGRAMIDGKWSHIGRFKGPMLRDLAPRAPYFHNGFAADLDAVVEFYDTRFNIKFTKQEKTDLVAFLRSL
jgi:cytochrome c peroxidase